MSNSYSPITIVCVRDVDDSVNDDCITIKPHMTSAFEQLYSVTHKVGIDHSPEEYQIKTTTELTSDGLLVYIDSLLDLLYYDEDPFEAIQFDIPSLPSILVKSHNLDLVKDRIVSYVKSLLSSSVSWPRNAYIQHTTGIHSVESEEHNEKQKKKNTNKNHKKHKNHKHTCESYHTSQSEESTRLARPLSAREHLFFDEDNNISSRYYEF